MLQSHNAALLALGLLHHLTHSSGAASTGRSAGPSALQVEFLARAEGFIKCRASYNNDGGDVTRVAIRSNPDPAKPIIRNDYNGALPRCGRVHAPQPVLRVSHELSWFHQPDLVMQVEKARKQEPQQQQRTDAPPALRAGSLEGMAHRSDCSDFGVPNIIRVLYSSGRDSIDSDPTKREQLKQGILGWQYWIDEVPPARFYLPPLPILFCCHLVRSPAVCRVFQQEGQRLSQQIEPAPHGHSVLALCV